MSVSYLTVVTTANATQLLSVVSGETTWAASVGFAAPTNPAPVIVSVDNTNTTIQRGRTKVFQVSVLTYQDGSTWTLSNPGLLVTNATVVSGKVRLRVTAATNAALGPADLTVIAPDGQGNTLVGAI